MSSQKHTFGNEKRDPNAFPLDDKAYPLQEGTPELEFWKVQTGMRDNEELKQHIIKIQKEAYSVSVHPMLCFLILNMRCPHSFLRMGAFAISCLLCMFEAI